MDQENVKRIDTPSLLFIIWFITWLIALIALPNEYKHGPFFLLGLAPVIGWFLMKPKKRVVWVTRALLGINGLDRQ